MTLSDIQTWRLNGKGPKVSSPRFNHYANISFVYRGSKIQNVMDALKAGTEEDCTLIIADFSDRQLALTGRDIAIKTL